MTAAVITVIHNAVKGLVAAQPQFSEIFIAEILFRLYCPAHAETSLILIVFVEVGAERISCAGKPQFMQRNCRFQRPTVLSGSCRCFYRRIPRGVAIWNMRLPGGPSCIPDHATGVDDQLTANSVFDKV